MAALSRIFQSACTIVLGYGNQISSQETEKIQKIKMKKEDDYGEICASSSFSEGFQMPLHYPRYKKGDYEKMEEWKLDILLKQYGFLNFNGTLEEKRTFAMGTFLWPDQL
ncbi:uncharacterized protein [Nicotiana sylvestris]|uniref:Uncharacterized protein LOC104210936 n=1 Tax=Nicotiana sylvestris TaxID=4096 RepID=A0A1U7V8S9_NICSY|nr:PREDICTED: uncharacterized protein LOC104210936 [Nicotiana sylvestris]XP_009768819.1 PREDICTED: uncharacterized protein LOC104219786 [Nicotiana sylvestris]